MAKRDLPRVLVGIAFITLCVLIGVLIGAILMLDRTAPAPKAEVARPAPTVVPIAVAPAPKPAVASVRVSSEPDGAEVVLVADGTPAPLGTTPLAAQLDPTKTYDLVFTREGFRTRIEHVDPTQMPRVDVVLEPAPVIAAKPVVRHARRRVVKAPAPDVEVVQSGLLQVSTKVPCRVAIDGKPSGLHAPLAGIALRVGTHAITLSNIEQGIEVTRRVEIAADHPTTLALDLTP